MDMENQMLAEKALAMFDKGTALPHVIDELLRICGRRQVEVGMTLVKSALAMHDRSPHRLHTPIKRVIGPGCIEVGDIIIAFRGSAFEKPAGRKQHRTLLELPNSKRAASENLPGGTSCSPLSQFVAQMVTLRSIGSNPAIRSWLAALPG